MGIWIMGFDNLGPRIKPVEFKELDFALELPKNYFNMKLNLVVIKS